MNRPMKSESIAKFLAVKARPELSMLYNSGMEVQVNVAQDNGERVDEEYNGRKSTSWQDSAGNRWSSFRLPKNANSEPEDNDKPIHFDLAKHAEGIGLTGWDWKNKKSLWFAYDFDVIMGHSEKHKQKLTDQQLDEVTKAACELPWVTVRKSTSGNGLHLYVFVDGIATSNHTEHAALARAILNKMSALAKFDFDSKVDVCGGVMWIWHRKFDKVGGVNGEGLKLVKEGVKLQDIPANWRDHVTVINRGHGFNKPKFVGDTEINSFEQMCSQHPHVDLDDTHRGLFQFLDKTDAYWWWDADHHMMVCHTYDLKQAHIQLNYRGIFETDASGKDQGLDQNCFAFPMRDGAWVVRRHGQGGVSEAKTWDTDSNGYTKCYLNREPELGVVARAYNGAEDENGAFEFKDAKTALEALKRLGVTLDLNEAYMTRKAFIKPSKDGRLIFGIARNSDDNPELLQGWVERKSKWLKMLNVQMQQNSTDREIRDYDDVLRHLVCETGDAGWCFKSDGHWVQEPGVHVKMALKAMGHPAREADLIMGKSVINRWTLTNEPFQNEYLGDRKWNRDAAQFAVSMAPDDDNLQYPTWQSLLDHCGSNLTPAVLQNKWCYENNIKTGGEYLMLWFAALVQQPTEPLPYLFMYGPQGSGKSVLHEAFSLLVTKGVVRADAALISQSGFNGELMSAILCVVEETDLRQNRSQAYNRIKDWVTGRTINIHIKGVTPYSAVNTTHWIQCSNEVDACPIFPGDTRIVMCYVKALEPDQHIPKQKLLLQLKKEGPDFLRKIRKLELPASNDRLLIPIVESDDKIKASKLNQSELDAYIEENCYIVPGKMILLSEFYERFRESLTEAQRVFWSKQKVTKNMPSPIVKGRVMKEAAKHFYGNISWTPKLPTDPDLPSLVSENDTLEPVK